MVKSSGIIINYQPSKNANSAVPKQAKPIHKASATAANKEAIKPLEISRPNYFFTDYSGKVLRDLGKVEPQDNKPHIHSDEYQ